MNTRQKRTLSFSRKPQGVFGGQVEDKRQRLSSAYVFTILRLAAAYSAAYPEVLA